MPKDNAERPRKRFSKSGHTSYGRPEGEPPAPPPPSYVPRPEYPPPTYDAPRYAPPPNYEPPRYAPPPNYEAPRYAPPPPDYPPQPTQRLNYAPPPGYGPPSAGRPVDDGFDATSYHAHDASHYEPGPIPPGAKVGAGRRVLSGSNHLARGVTTRVIGASKADGADESGLTALIWNQVLSYGSDAMITVALAGTVFFGASAHAQKGNVLLYLLVTMAPFAVVAPIIGPALDRVQHGRRWAMAGTAVGRAILAVIMAGHATDLLVLYPCALGSLVLSKAYSVIRAAALPRLVPPRMTLVKANSRLSMFGLAAALVGGAFVGLIIKATGSYAAGLWVTAIAFAATGYFAFRLPKQVDSSPPVPAVTRDAEGHRIPKAAAPRLALGPRLALWAGRGFNAPVISSMQAESSLRFISGFLTIFLAFYIEATAHGLSAALDLGGVGIAAGVGNFAGTAAGSRFRLTHPEYFLMVGGVVAAAACLLTAVLFSMPIAIVCVFISAVVNSLGKVSLDAIVQRDVIESLRSSAFGRSETFLQLAWVLGAAIGVLLPSDDGSLGLWVGGGIMTAVTVFIVLRYRAMKKNTATAS